MLFLLILFYLLGALMVLTMFTFDQWVEQHDDPSLFDKVKERPVDFSKLSKQEKTWAWVLLFLWPVWVPLVAAFKRNRWIFQIFRRPGRGRGE